MSSPLVSIIILSYNNLQYYKECLESVLKQNYSNIEIIFNDDGSSNFKQDEIISFIKENKNNNIKRTVINHNENNLGVVKNYNKALRLSKGDYIFYIGLDDMLHDKDVISDVVDFFEKTGNLIITGYRAIYDEDMKNCHKVLPRENETKFIKKGDPKYLHIKLSRGNFIAGSCTPFSKELIEKYGYLDEDYTLLEDYPRYLNLTRRDCKINFIERKLIKYRLGGITNNNEDNKVLKRDISKASEKEIGDFVGQFFKRKINSIKDRDLIAWGACEGYQNNREQFETNIRYFVDSDKNKYNTLVDGKKIYSPQKLREEKREEVFVVVFSRSHYNEISEELNDYGFIEFENYCCFRDLIISN
ncbi:glycosyl transferase [Halobacteroides halobius DSM 5150]|uniref:Glycosyl transferase n=1 Tax=Halobacteroides halobius (strain ATCC 35273 / DSM 5150 / MD-1) TaxID=748449 RepID=L0KC45_HALHC|nr:glycosyltransferase [Halobacteroides halobius]AGB42125.1 glycosyl transferase [Halobacteroides halobius DSM 5150]